jgi:hypothetical protein
MNLQEEYNLLSNKMMMKQRRNLILGETDKYMLSDFPITSEQ